MHVATIGGNDRWSMYYEDLGLNYICPYCHWMRLFDLRPSSAVYYYYYYYGCVHEILSFQCCRNKWFSRYFRLTNSLVQMHSVSEADIPNDQSQADSLQNTLGFPHARENHLVRVTDKGCRHFSAAPSSTVWICKYHLNSTHFTRIIRYEVTQSVSGRYGIHLLRCFTSAIICISYLNAGNKMKWSINKQTKTSTIKF